MNDLTIGQLLDIAGRLTTATMLIVILYGGRQKWWVFGWTYADKVAECEKWESLALRSMGALESTTETIAPTVPKAHR